MKLGVLFSKQVVLEPIHVLPPHLWAIQPMGYPAHET